MEDILGNASSRQLLILIGFVLVLAALFASVIVLSFVRRGRKSEMRLGTATGSATKSASRSSKAQSATNSLTAQTSHDDGPSLAKRLNLQEPTNDEDGVPRETPSDPNNHEPIDLTSRLNALANQPATPVSSLVEEPDELLRLLRDSDTGQLIVEVADQRYTKLAEVPDKNLGEYLLQLAAHVLNFTNGVVMTETGMKNLGVPKVGPTPKPIASTDRRRTQVSIDRFSMIAPDEAETALLGSLQANSQSDAQRTRSGLFNLGAATQPEPTVAALNLADQINEIVQARLRYAPLSQRAEVSISSSLSGGIRIKVNNHYYDTPDEIPDLEVRQLIKDPIKEWERS